MERNILYKYILKIKRNLFSIILLLFLLCLILFSKETLEASKKAITLWATILAPSLLPFFIATGILANTNILSILERMFNKIMRPIFNVPGCAAFALIMGFICGYPVGSKIVSDLRQQELCTKEEAERLVCFTNNAGPLFILSSVGVGLFGNASIGFLLLFTHILASLTVGVLFRFWDKKNSSTISSTKKYISIGPSGSFGSILRDSVKSAMENILLVGGFVLLGIILTSIFEKIGIIQILSNILAHIFNILGFNITLAHATALGIFEITNGISSIAAIPLKELSVKVILCAFLLGFSGFTILLQVLGFTSKTDISIKPYILGKLLHGIIAAIYTTILLQNTVLFGLDL